MAQRRRPKPIEQNPASCRLIDMAHHHDYPNLPTISRNGRLKIVTLVAVSSAIVSMGVSGPEGVAWCPRWGEGGQPLPHAQPLGGAQQG